MTAFDPAHADVARDIDRDTDIAEAVEAARADMEPVCGECSGDRVVYVYGGRGGQQRDVCPRCHGFGTVQR